MVGADQAGLKEVNLSSSVHLAFDEFELGDLTFSLSIGPRQYDSSPYPFVHTLPLVTNVLNCLQTISQERTPYEHEINVRR
jgi:hypothetical protein